MIYQRRTILRGSPHFRLPFPLSLPLVFSSTNPSSFNPSVSGDESLIPGKSFAGYTRNGSDHASARMGIDRPVSSTFPQFINRNCKRYRPAVRMDKSEKMKNVAGMPPRPRVPCVYDTGGPAGSSWEEG